ncbi:hypothetical protein KCU75_g46, partial [Aureobasidium melanogenum]
MQKLEHHAVRTGGCRLTSCHRTSDPRVETMVVMFCPEASPQLWGVKLFSLANLLVDSAQDFSLMFGNFSGANAGFDFLVHVKVVMTSLAAWRDSKLEAMLSIEGIGKR